MGHIRQGNIGITFIHQKVSYDSKIRQDRNTYLATYPPVGPAAPIPAGGGPPPPTPPSSPPFQIASSSLNSVPLKRHLIGIKMYT